MKAMDCDGDERVSLVEFRKWWESKGGMEYGADPAMWSAGAAEEWLESDAAMVEAAASKPQRVAYTTKVVLR